MTPWRECISVCVFASPFFPFKPHLHLLLPLTSALQVIPTNFIKYIHSYFSSWEYSSFNAWLLCSGRSSDQNKEHKTPLKLNHHRDCWDVLFNKIVGYSSAQTGERSLEAAGVGLTQICFNQDKSLLLSSEPFPPLCFHLSVFCLSCLWPLSSFHP